MNEHCTAKCHQTRKTIPSLLRNLADIKLFRIACTWSAHVRNKLLVSIKFEAHKKAMRKSLRSHAHACVSSFRLSNSCFYVHKNYVVEGKKNKIKRIWWGNWSDHCRLHFNPFTIQLRKELAVWFVNGVAHCSRNFKCTGSFSSTNQR